MSKALYPVLAQRKAAGAGERDLRNVVAASAEGPDVYVDPPPRVRTVRRAR